MILYKYFSYEAGIAALNSRRLGFREPIYFNDPFELSYLSNIDASPEEIMGLSGLIDNIKEAVVILSLTRTPFNPLMWAHYGQDHTGFVVGYDVSDEFLTDEAFNLIPVDKGDVIYTSSKSPFTFDEQSIDLLRQAHFVARGVELSSGEIENPEQVESILRKIFLYKHSCWAYEEEVRVVKVLHSLFHTAEEWQSHTKRGFDTPSKMVKPRHGYVLINGLYLYRHIVNIKEVFIGIRNPLLDLSLKKEADKVDHMLCESAEENCWGIYSMVMNKSSWGLNSVEAQTDIFVTHKKNRGLLNSFQFDSREAEFLKHVLPKLEILPGDEFELTNWNSEVFLKKNDEFVNRR